jgi:hypothetical protein
VKFRKRQWSGGRRSHKRVVREIPEHVDDLKEALQKAYTDLDEALDKLDLVKSIISD